MRKLFAAVLALSLTALTACGGSSTTTTAAPAAAPAETKAEAAAAAPAAASDIDWPKGTITVTVP